MKKAIPFLFFCILLMISVYATQPLGITPVVWGELQELQESSGKKLYLVVLVESSNPSQDASIFFRQKQSDLLALYSIKEKKTVIVQEDAGVLPDKVIERVLEAREEEKESISNDEDAHRYLLRLLNDLTQSVERQEGYCSILKDGFCDRNCPGDLDCKCGNTVCEGHESAETCPQDCHSNQLTCRVVRNNVCDPECEFDVDCSVNTAIEKARQFKQEQPRRYALIALGLWIALATLVALCWYYVRKSYNISMKRKRK
jgi:hypothetical protein